MVFTRSRGKPCDNFFGLSNEEQIFFIYTGWQTILNYVAVTIFGFSSFLAAMATELSHTKHDLSLFVVWQGIYDLGQTQQKDRDRGFILLPARPAVLPRSDAGSDSVEPAPCFVIQNCQSHYSSRCPMYGTC